MITILNNDISICKDKECYLLFYFTAKWCGPCQRIKPLLQKISDGSDSSVLKVYIIDIDENEVKGAEPNEEMALKFKSAPSSSKIWYNGINL